MRIRIKQRADLGIRRIDSLSKIVNVVAEENLLYPEKESLSIFFRGEDSSGILNLSTQEFKSLSNSIKPHTHLVKKVKLPIKEKKKINKTKKSKIKKTKSKRKTIKKSRKRKNR